MAERRFEIGLLAGGKSSRFGSDKALAEIGGRTMLETLYDRFSVAGKVSVSVNHIDRYRGLSIPVSAFVPDVQPDIGPMEGLRRLLYQASTDYIFVTATDTPNVTPDVMRYLSGYLGSDVAGVVFRNGETIHPLTGFYHRDLAPLMDRAIAEGHYGVTRFICRQPVKQVAIEDTRFGAAALYNVNHRRDWRLLTGRRHVLCISGIKNSGKTTLIERLIPALKPFFPTIGVIKHDGHDFVMDYPGTDTSRYVAAGARQVGIFSAHRAAFLEMRPGRTEMDLLGMMPDCDLILLEGFKHHPYPKIEIVREGIGVTPVTDARHRLAIVTDIADFESAGPVLPLDDVERLAAFVYAQRTALIIEGQ
ncbi:MAG: molybdopterin-guanine dinucleotide biosynthesis protein B [Eubacteriales bacterium]|nr:molybdopterin-guanine dinucleotide biosynthesis protein B [Eubacteriales bacterium]